MTLRETSTGNMLALSIDFTTLSGRMTATLSGHTRAAIIDGLLWWALNRKLDAFVAACMHLPIHASMQHAQALHRGESLVHYVHFTPWHKAEEKRASSICGKVEEHLPELAPLASLSPAHQREHDQLITLATLLRKRLAHPADPYHGLEGILVEPAQQAA